MNSINSGLLKNSLNFSLEGLGRVITSAVTGVPAAPSSTTPTPTNPTSNTPPSAVVRSCPEGLETVQGRYQLCKTVSQKMKDLIAAAAKDGVTLTLASAYRTADSGTLSGGTTAAAAGRSLHQVGLAVDFNGFKRGPSTDARFVWLLNNAGKYGFYNTLYLSRSDEYNHWSTSGR
jgi:LAS superfamily LD-carboxypeptidase LdcB